MSENTKEPTAFEKAKSKYALTGKSLQSMLHFERGLMEGYLIGVQLVIDNQNPEAIPHSINEIVQMCDALIASHGTDKIFVNQQMAINALTSVREFAKGMPDYSIPNQTNQEAVPIYQISFMQGLWSDVSKDYAEKYPNAPQRIVYLAPLQPQTVKDALEAAAKICDQWVEAEKLGLATHPTFIAIAIRDLIK